jgi:uncharacterized protein (UPF0147 family)
LTVKNNKLNIFSSSNKQTNKEKIQNILGTFRKSMQNEPEPENIRPTTSENRKREKEEKKENLVEKERLHTVE